MASDSCSLKTNRKIVQGSEDMSSMKAKSCWEISNENRVLLRTFLTLLAFLKDILDAEKNRWILYMYYSGKIPNVLFLKYMYVFHFYIYIFCMALHIVISPILCMYIYVYVTHMCMLKFSVWPQAFLQPIPQTV